MHQKNPSLGQSSGLHSWVNSGVHHIFWILEVYTNSWVLSRMDFARYGDGKNTFIWDNPWLDTTPLYMRSTYINVDEMMNFDRVIDLMSGYN